MRILNLWKYEGKSYFVGHQRLFFNQGNGTRTKGKQMLMSCPKPQNIIIAKIALKLTGLGTWYLLNIFQCYGLQGT